MGFKDGWKPVQELVPRAFSASAPFGTHLGGCERGPDVVLVDAINIMHQVFTPGGVQTPRNLATSINSRFIAPYWKDEKARRAAVAAGGRVVVVFFWDNPMYVPRAKEMEQSSRTKARAKAADIGEVVVAHDSVATGQLFPAVNPVYPDTGQVEVLGSDAVAWWKHDPTSSGPPPVSLNLGAGDSMGLGDWKKTYLHVRANRILLQRALRTAFVEVISPPPGAVFVLFDATGEPPIVVEGERVTDVASTRVSDPSSKLCAADVTAAVATSYCVSSVSTANDDLEDEVGEADVALFVKLVRVLERWWPNTTASEVNVLIESTDSDIIAYGALFLERFLVADREKAGIPHTLSLRLSQRLKRATSKRPNANYASVNLFHDWARSYLAGFSGFDALQSLAHVTFLMWGGGCDFVNRVAKTKSVPMVKRFHRFCSTVAVTVSLAIASRGDRPPAIDSHSGITVAETDMGKARRTVFSATHLLRVHLPAVLPGSLTGEPEWNVTYRSAATRTFFGSVSGFGRDCGSKVSEDAMARLGAACMYLSSIQSNPEAAELEIWLRNTAFMVSNGLAPIETDCLETKNGMTRWGFGLVPSFPDDTWGHVVRVLHASESMRSGTEFGGVAGTAAATESHGFQLPMPVPPQTPREDIATPPIAAFAAMKRASKKITDVVTKARLPVNPDDGDDDSADIAAEVDRLLVFTGTMLKHAEKESALSKNATRSWYTKKAREGHKRRAGTKALLVPEIVVGAPAHSRDEFEVVLSDGDGAGASAGAGTGARQFVHFDLDVDMLPPPSLPTTRLFIVEEDEDEDL